MSDFVPLWTRTQSAPIDRVAEVMLVAFSRGALRSDVPMAVAQFGVPSRAAIDALDIREHARATAPDWFDGFRTGAIGAIARRDLGDELAALAAADHCVTIACRLRDPADLGYLQAAWAVARWACARGATCVLAAHAIRFRTAAGLTAPDAPLDVAAEVSRIFETDAVPGAAGHVLHTRGLIKFGRPDVVAVCGPDDAALVGDIIGQLAVQLADGWLPGLPRHGVDLAESLSIYLTADTAGVATRLHLNNDARVLVRDDGAPLVGVRAALLADSGHGR